MIKRLGALMLAISVVVGAVLMNTKIDSVLAVSSGNGGYYEVYNKKGVVEFDSAVGAVSSAVIAGINTQGGQLNQSVSVSANGNSVTINEFNSTLLNSMVLGEYYTLTINGTLSKQFRFVTKAIANKDDVAILNLTNPDIAVTGYYVLVNDLVLEQGEENSNDLNGSASGKGYSYTAPSGNATQGFRGTFDGQGHNIEFWANEGGFFGYLGRGAVIKNTGFINVKVYLQGERPVIYGGTNITSSEASRARIESVCVRMANGTIPSAGIGPASIPLVLKNVVLEFPGANVDHNSPGLSGGALWPSDWGWWPINNNAPGTNKIEARHSDVYVIGKMPLMHYKHIPSKNVEKKKGYYYTEDGILCRDWIEGWAENEGVTEDLYNGDKVYKGIRKYNTFALLSEDTVNDYSTFDTRYWAVEEYGIPVWKNGIEDNFEIFVSTFAERTSAAVYLELGGVETATIGFGLGGISAQDAELTFEFVQGEEFISLDAETGVVTALKEGMSQIKAKCTYNGKDYEKKYTFYVSIAEGYEPPKSGGCGSVIIDGGSIGGGALMILSAVGFVVLKKKSNTHA